jgi:hypothetical protein
VNALSSALSALSSAPWLFCRNLNFSENGLKIKFIIKSGHSIFSGLLLWLSFIFRDRFLSFHFHFSDTFLNFW